MTNHRSKNKALIPRFQGVYKYISNKRRHRGKPDVCFYIRYKIDDREKTEKVGWLSEGYTAQLANEVRNKRIREARHAGEIKTARDIREEKRKSDRTLDEIKEAYFKSERGIRLKGRKTDLNRYDQHLKHLFGEKPISTLAPVDIEDLKMKMAGLATATVANAIELLRRLINYGTMTGLCSKPGFKIEVPRKHNDLTEYLEPEQAERLLAVLDEWKRQDVARMVKVAYLTGMRRGELFKFTDEALDFQHMVIVLEDPKGGRPASIPMSSPVMQLLIDQINWRDRVYPGSQYVFPGRAGGLRTDCSAVKRIKEKAGLPKKFRIMHGLRHHFAVTLANSGQFTLDMIGELLTHKSSAMTRRYAKFLPVSKKTAAEAATAILLEKP